MRCIEMRNRVVVLLVAGVGALAAPASTSAQLPPVPPVPTVVPLPKPPPVPVPTVVPLPKPPPVPVPTVVPVPTAPPSVPVPTVPGVTGPSGGGGGSSAGGGGGSSSPSSGGGGGGGGGGSTSSPGGGGSAAAPGASSGGAGARGGSSSRGRGARAGTAARTPAQRHRAERKLRRLVTRLSACLNDLNTVQRRVLVLRTGLGSARPHSRRGVARLLDLRVRRVARIERHGVREARHLSRAGACGGVAAPSTSTALAAGGSPGGGDGSGSGGSGGGGLVPEPDKGQVAGESTAHDSTTGSGGVRAESETKLPPPLTGGGTGRDAGGVSLAIGITLILLALLAGFATPHMRARVRSS
jgi:hypothetical protein